METSLKHGKILISLYLFLLSFLSISSIILFLSSFSSLQTYLPLYLSPQYSIFIPLIPLTSGILGMTSLTFYVCSESRFAPSLYIVLFVVSRFTAFLASSYYPQQVILTIISFLFPDITIYHSLAYLVCMFVAPLALMYINEAGVT